MHAGIINAIVVGFIIWVKAICTSSTLFQLFAEVSVKSYLMSHSDVPFSTSTDLPLNTFHYIVLVMQLHFAQHLSVDYSPCKSSKSQRATSRGQPL